MSKERVLMKKAEKGFSDLKYPDKYASSALSRLNEWLTDPQFEEYVPQIEHLIESEKWGLLLDSFYQVIPFGTGGRRGTVGIGPNRINPWTIRASAQGHCQYLREKFGEEAAKRGVVLTYDVRRYDEHSVYDDSMFNPIMNLSARDLAVAAAEVYAANGFRVFMFDGVRSTPMLSFAIRHLNAIAGDMFSASHNLPTDNGKKVYDHLGGQLIPPHDQALVDEVTRNVAEINRMPYDQAVKNGLVETLPESLDKDFIDAIRSVSLSGERDVKILYSPLHGTGLTSVYPALKDEGFGVFLDPATSTFSGGFENVTFNIPNPEVEQSFDTTYEPAEKAGADLIMNTDPDADRIGVMARHDGTWRFLTGNEIGILLTEYGISKLKSAGRPTGESVVVKTDVTSALIEEIALQNNVKCIGNLLVGFKYIAEELNGLEREGKADTFVIGAEESHGFLVGDYCRDKDAAGAAVWLAELAAEQKKAGRTLVAFLDEIYSRYGYCHNYLTEIRLLGARGVEQIASIMEHFRTKRANRFGRFVVKKMIDRYQGDPQPHLSATDTSSRNVLVFYFENLDETRSLRVTVRPSGTEPKIKMYFEVLGKPFALEKVEENKAKTTAVRKSLEKEFMDYCYRILGVDFPERGYLLFWQLPLDLKMKYFEIEPKIIDLKRIDDKNERRRALDKLLKFLGSNPIEKVENAFEAEYGEGVLQKLDLEPLPNNPKQIPLSNN